MSNTQFFQLMNEMEIELLNHNISYRRNSFSFIVPGNEITFRGCNWELRTTMERFEIKDSYSILVCLSEECFIEECYQKYLLIKCIPIIDDMKYEFIANLIKIGK